MVSAASCAFCSRIIVFERQQTFHLKVPWFKSRLGKSSFSVVCNFPSLIVDYYIQLGNLLSFSLQQFEKSIYNHINMSNKFDLLLITSLKLI